MKAKLSDLWRWEGSIGRGPYLLLGCVLFAVKYNLDRLTTWLITGKSWPFVDVEGFVDYVLRRTDYRTNHPLAFALLITSLPFMWSGLVLTIRRLGSAHLPRWLAALYFVPFVKLVLFAMLSIVPDAMNRHVEKQKRNGLFERLLSTWLPHSPWGSAFVAALNVAVTGGLLAWTGTTWLRSYQWAVFIGVPFGMGFLAAALHCYRGHRTLGACLAVAGMSVAILGAGLLAFAVEGVLCLVMAAPLALVLSGLGAALAFGFQKVLWPDHAGGRLMCVALVWVPLLGAVEHFSPPAVPLLRVMTSVEVAAPPEIVWRHVVSFSDLPPPTDFIFRHGIAYPVRARIFGEGVGAIRRCEFSTGAFVEPIEVWDAPELLKFSVIENPAPMEEWTPYRRIEPPHLHGFLCSQAGQFRLVRQADGRTLLEGTTWYHHHLWPASYWQQWSDYIIHRIHRRVLAHVKALAENENRKR
jgi:uncharacterized membrane protein YhaH (DUF805 family)